MQAADAAWVFADLERAGALTPVQLERLVAGSRNARGRRTETPTPVGTPFGVYLTRRRETIERAGYGDHAAVALAAVCPAGTTLAIDDQLVVTAGPRQGERYRVTTIPEGEGPVAPVLAGIERMRSAA